VRLDAVEYLDGLLLAVPALVNGLQGDDPQGAERTVEWLQSVERRLTEQEHPAAASFAALRARLWSVGRGLRLPGLALSNTRSARTWRQIGASAILDEATQTLGALVAPSRAAVDEARAALRQALELGGIREQMGGPTLPWHAPAELWGALLGDSDLAVLATRAASLLGQADAQALLAQEAPANSHPKGSADEDAPTVGALTAPQAALDPPTPAAPD
jgi:hypothetical protein